MTAKLSEFEGREVDRATVAIRKAGDGLSDGLSIDPDEIHQGEIRYYVLRAECGAVNFKTDPKKITTREHVMNAVAISPIDADAAEEFLQGYAERVAKRRDEVDGQLRFQQEQDAEDRERRDEWDDDTEGIAQDAAQRVKDGG